MTRPLPRPGLCVIAILALIPASAVAEGLRLTHVPNAAPSIPGMAMPNSLSPELFQIVVAQGFTPLDQRLLALIAPRVLSGEVRLLVLLTKADKLSRRDAQKSLAAAQAVLADVASDEADVGLLLFSALSKQGLGDAAAHLWGWVHPAAD